MKRGAKELKFKESDGRDGRDEQVSCCVMLGSCRTSRSFHSMEVVLSVHVVKTL